MVKPSLFVCKTTAWNEWKKDRSVDKRCSYIQFCLADTIYTLLRKKWLNYSVDRIQHTRFHVKKQELVLVSIALAQNESHL